MFAAPQGGGARMIFCLFVAACAALPGISMLVEWAVSTRLSERHHSSHDTYVIPFALTSALSLSMMFMGTLGLVLCWLCHVGVFKADPTIMLGFFSSFVLVMFVMWSALRHYRVATFDDHLEVTPFVGGKRIVRYDDIDCMRWSRPLAISSRRNILIFSGGEVCGVLIGTFDLDQILLRINRNDVFDNS